MGLLQDLRYGMRMLVRTPAASVVAILSLALGIAANSAILSVVDALGLRPLAIEDPGGLVRVFTSDAKTPQGAFSEPDARDLLERNRVFSSVAAYNRGGVSVSEKGGPAEVALLGTVTGEFFRLLGIRPAKGRLLGPADDGQAAGPVPIVVSHAFWGRRFDRDPNVVGRAIDLNRKPAVVVGVLPADFDSLEPYMAPAVWVTDGSSPQLSPSGRRQPEDRKLRHLGVVARARPGVTLAQVQADVARIGRELEREYAATNAKVGFSADFETAIRARRLGPLRLILMGIVGFVLLIACANVAGLLLGRAEARRREIAVRIAVGAGRLRLVRQLLTESVLLSAAAGAAGLLLTRWFLGLVPALIPTVAMPLTFEFRLDGRVLAFAAIATLATVPVFGLLPALSASRIGVAPLIRGDGDARRAGRLRVGPRDLLVVGQIALSAVLLVSAGLLVRSYVNSQGIDPGFERRPMVIATVAPIVAGYDDARSLEFGDRLLERLSALPGVEAVAVGRRLPLSPFGGGATMDVSVPGSEAAGASRAAIRYNVVGPGFFGTMGTRIVRGRDFTAADRETAPAVMLVSAATARRYWPAGDPIGRRVRVGPPPGVEREIVGIVQDVKQNGLGEVPEPYMYLPLRQQPAAEMTFVVRVGRDPRAMAGEVRREILALDRAVPMLQVTTIDEHMQLALFMERMAAALVGVLGLVGLLLALVGLYAVVSFLVARRTREIGIRMALGASPAQVLAHVLRKSSVLAFCGIAVGLSAAVAVSRAMGRALYGVSPMDPVTLIGVAAGILVTTVLASYVPARRAARVAPMAALRRE